MKTTLVVEFTGEDLKGLILNSRPFKDLVLGQEFSGKNLTLKLDPWDGPKGGIKATLKTGDEDGDGDDLA